MIPLRALPPEGLGPSPVASPAPTPGVVVSLDARRIASTLFETLAGAPCERSVARAVLEASQRLTGAAGTAVYLHAARERPPEVHVAGALDDATLDAYEARGREEDPVYRWVSVHHAALQATHEELTIRSESNRRLSFARAGKPRLLRHYMVAPIVAGADLVGSMHFVSLTDRPFDLRIGSALALHVSSRVTLLRSLDGITARWGSFLSPREHELATMAADGLSTEQMAGIAGISPNTVKRHLKALYAKLGVASRVELATLLLRGPAGVRSLRPALPEGRQFEGGVAYRYPTR